MRTLTNLLAIGLFSFTALHTQGSNMSSTVKASEMYADGFSKFRFGGCGETAANYMDYGWGWVAPQGMSRISRTTVSIPRFTLAFDYKFSPKWVLSSEVGFEYRGAGAAQEVEWYEENGEYETEIEKGGEITLEQFHISYPMNKRLSFRFGHMIVPVGLTNVHHDPLDFFGVYHPEGKAILLPSTWHETGVVLFGDLGNFDYRLQVVSGLDPRSFRMGSWVGKGTQSASGGTQLTHPAFMARVNCNGVKKFRGSRVGASFYYNQPSENSSKPLHDQGEKYPLTIMAMGVQYKSPSNNLIARDDIVHGHPGDSNALTKVNNNSPSASGYPNSTVTETAVSYATEVSCNVGSFLSRKAPRIYPFIRYEYYNPMRPVEKGSNKLANRHLQKSVITAGLNCYALPDLVVKANYMHRVVDKGDYDSQNMVSVDTAYIGWFSSR